MCTVQAERFLLAIPAWLAVTRGLILRLQNKTHCCDNHISVTVDLPPHIHKYVETSYLCAKTAKPKVILRFGACT